MIDFNLEEELRGNYRVSTQMKKVWQVETDLLVHFIEVCRKENLRFWVDGGTMLGAVRHHGFIPWDDDVDVCMPRADYDRLVGMGDRLFKYPYFLQTAYSDKDYFRGHAQLRNSETAAIRPSDSFQPFNQGIFIDIFVLDEAPDDETERKALARVCRKTQRFLKTKNMNILASGRLGLIFRKIKCRREVRRRGWSTIYREMEEKLRAVSPECCACWAELAFSGDDIMFPKHIFNETVWIPFENISVPVPKEYDLFLRTQFGDDYMTPRQDPSYHGELVFDTEHSYTDLLPKVRKEYRSSVLKRLLKKL
jgi:lipopolysaccharide cholinephosphotransferase